MVRHVRLEDLLGSRVVDADGRAVGRIEEVLVQRQGRALVVREYRMGTYAWLERFAGPAFARSVLARVPLTRPAVYRVPWRVMDLSDPARPRLRCDRAELESVAA